MLDSADLYQPVDGTAAPRPTSPVADDLVVRVERETLRRFPATGCVLFTIRTHLTKAADLAADPVHGPVIAEALAAMPAPAFATTSRSIASPTLSPSCLPKLDTKRLNI